LRTVEELGAFRTLERNLIAGGGGGEPVEVAEISAAGFRVARVPPLLGRPLVDADERADAPPVVVLGHDLWRTRFGSDPGVVGRAVRLGNTVHTVVGVMPEGFAFPMNHRAWTPLRADPAAYERRQGPGITVFGRLAPGASLADARAEMEAIGRRTAAAFPDTHARLRPLVLPYTALFMDGTPRWALHVAQLLVSLLLVVICVNVAVLVYARTATRQGEIAVRSALGASRRRIVAQLFTEALVLSAAAAAVGLLAARLVLAQVDAFIARELAHFGGVPFWMEFGLSRGAVLYVAGLAVLGAAIVGVVPALQATGRPVQASLRGLGGGTGMQMGRTWTVLIVAQVAFAVAVLPGAVFTAWESLRYGTSDPGPSTENVLTAELVMDREDPPSAAADAYAREWDARYAALQGELARRLEAEPGVAAATFASSAPGQEPEARVEVEGAPSLAEPAASAVRSGRVAANFFEALGVPVLTGRGLRPEDAGAASTAVVVNRAFVEERLGGGNALGRRVRFLERGEGERAEPGPWHEVVGVVDDFPAHATEPGAVRARVYHPLAPGGAGPVLLAVRVRGVAPEAYAGRLREVATALDPALHLRETRTLDDLLRQEQGAMRLTALAVALVTLSVLLLSAGGIYALMSFTVARRRREIGIQAALGADPRRILGSVFSRALGQLGLGVAVGLAVAGLLEALSGGEILGGRGLVLLPVVAALMVAVGLLAALGPARRGLRIQPSEALRADA
ncbi:MAG TPA: ABC transporter permease, partial [Longimicrobiaceae bacterium]|nr:ABC transporter permease [Longimicrobiaceae bacterium]